MPSSDDRLLAQTERGLWAAAQSLGCTRSEVSPMWHKTKWTAADFRTAVDMGWTPADGWPAALKGEI